MSDTILKKKKLLLFILEILKRYSDEENPLTIATIEKLLLKKYELQVGRKAIKRNLEHLLELGYNIEYSVQNRKGINGENEEIKTDWYLIRDFTDSELRLIIENLLFSKYIPDVQKKTLIQKIENLSNEKFKSRTKHIKVATANSLDSQELFHTIEILDEAIEQNRQIVFHYNFYATDKKKHNYTDSIGLPRKYIVSPYYIVSSNNRYYLICNHQNKDELFNYRIDRITNISILKEKMRRPIIDIKGLKAGFDLSKYMSEHLYMFSGEIAPVTFCVEKIYVDDVIDWFGKDIQLFNENKSEVTVRVRTNLYAMKIWAIQYGTHVRVLKPQKLVDWIKSDLQKTLKGYER